ncbi:hypothetical protein AYI68_g2044 [Smittium mucronatum]|uniref:Uncharacterized protein n=1 Tax=Smittium mucronatum TaxID=133383 RepID=A0A1R0GQM8_9FUNG|nr:hypothetical protein AYI68_g6782 [Smittium mucronatum]OLY83805.1 hypothetical protein AYI68_g2044 [Smittium mucronatum]
MHVSMATSYDTTKSISDLPVPSYRMLREVAINLIHKHPILMMPARLPIFLYKLKRYLFPKYFLYSFLAAGGEILTDDLNLKGVHPDKLYAKAAIHLIELEKNNSDPYLVWACVLLSGYHWKIFDRDEVEYLIR